MTVPDTEQLVLGLEPRAGNEWFPLPSDYPDLTEDGQREARVVTVSKHKTPEEFVRAWQLFRRLYFFPQPVGAFYPTGVVSSPPAHAQWIHDFAQYSRNIIGAPRASAKSTVIAKELPLLLSLSRPYYQPLLILSNEKMVERRFNFLMRQLEGNDLLLGDFGLQKPPRGTDIWNLHQLSLRNGSSICGISVESRKLGLRPSCILLDDPEYNPKVEGNQTEFLQDIDCLLFNEMLPMLEPGCPLMWIGTLFSRRSALWAACMGEDSRFEYWNRRVYSMVHYSDGGEANYFWRTKWGPREVAAKRKELGPPAFEAQCQNNPISSADRTLLIHDAFNTYTVAGDRVRWQELGGQDSVQSFDVDYDEWLQGLAILLTVDPAATVSPNSDYSAVLVTGIDEKKWWWFLDLFLDRVTHTRLIAEIYRLGKQWNASLIGVENIGFQDQLRQRVQAEVLERSDEEMWQPRVYPITHPNKLSKEDRAEGVLSPRLSTFRIRLPAHLRDVWPMRELFTQITDFTADLALLPHDDAIDAAAMVGYCPRPSPSLLRKLDERNTLEQQIADGLTTERETGLPLALFVDPQHLDAAAMAARRARGMTASTRFLTSPQEKLTKKRLQLPPGVAIIRDRRPP